MKFFIIMIFSLICCITLTTCSKPDKSNEYYSSSARTASNIQGSAESADNGQDYNKLFELELYSDKQSYKTTDRIKIWATLKYIGSDSKIKIWHGDPYISFFISDGKDFNIGGIINTILTSTILEKNKLYSFDYSKNGGYSSDDPKADFWKKFYEEKDLYLPEGKYSIKVGGAFSITESPSESKNNLAKEIKISVKNQTGV